MFSLYIHLISTTQQVLLFTKFTIFGVCLQSFLLMRGNVNTKKNTKLVLATKRVCHRYGGNDSNKCLEKFYISARKQDGRHNKKSLTSICAALDHNLQNPPYSRPFFIFGDRLFSGANKTLNNLKTLSKTNEIVPNVHKSPLQRITLKNCLKKRSS